MASTSTFAFLLCLASQFNEGSDGPVDHGMVPIQAWPPLVICEERFKRTQSVPTKKGDKLQITGAHPSLFWNEHSDLGHGAMPDLPAGRNERL
jgi:hypothetical protein